MSWLLDKKTSCWSVMCDMSVSAYIGLVEAAHTNKGKIPGQRDVLKTTTAIRIRDRMVSDIQAGAVLPPVVLGVIVSAAALEEYPKTEAKTPQEFIPADSIEQLSIIDGMQRTAALKEALQAEPEIGNSQIRVEFWLTTSARSLIYRMLVLNTGQVPWTLNRQLSVVYEPLIEEIKRNVPDIERVFTPDNRGRRVSAGEFGSDSLIELYIAFSSRKVNIDTRESVSEEFSRIDFIENLSSGDFQEQFYQALTLLVNFDKEFSRFESEANHRFSKGRNIFDAQPSRIGFMVAIGQYVIGKPGLEKDATERARRISELQSKSTVLLKRLSEFQASAIGEFLRLQILSELLNIKVGQVGRHERNFFFESFKLLIDESFELPTMEPCWRAA